MSNLLSAKSSQLASSSSAGIAERKAVHRLIGIADTIFSKILPKKRQRKSSATASLPQRPETADVEVDQSPKITLPQRPHTAPQAIKDDSNKQIQVTIEFLRQVAQAICSHDEIASAQQCHRQSRYKLVALKRSLSYLQLRTIQMKDWLVHEKPRLVRENADPEAKSKLLDEEIAEYDTQLQEFDSAVQNIDGQLSQLGQTLEDFLEESENLQEGVVSDLRRLLGVEDLPGRFREERFATTQPIDEAELESYKENCQDFEKAVLFRDREEEEWEKYPRRPTEDWPLHFNKMRAKRQELDDILQKLAKLESAGTGGSELEEHQKSASAARHALAEAVEAVRCAGVIIESNGSIPIIECDPEDEYIYGLRERPQIDFDAEDALWEKEMTDEELQQHVDNTVQKTENWLSDAHLGVAPESAGPRSPTTPGTATFRERLGSIELGDSISEILKRTQEG